MSINRVTVTGNMTADPELKTTQSGTAVLNIRLAVNDRRKNQLTGEWEDAPNFFTVVAFGNRAEALAKHLRKGSKIAVDGKLRYRSWEAQDGSKRSTVEIVADDIEFMDPRPQSATQTAPQPAYAPTAPVAVQVPAPAPIAPQTAPQPPAAPTMNLAADDIPFD